jgi:hypothetical protein
MVAGSDAIPGWQALVEWFGGVPRFHDANLLDVRLASGGPSVLTIHAWRMTEEVDDQGYFVLDKHVTVTITLDDVTEVTLTHFNLPGIIFESYRQKLVTDRIGKAAYRGVA